jgi:hypothetical protein
MNSELRAAGAMINKLIKEGKRVFASYTKDDGGSVRSGFYEIAVGDSTSYDTYSDRMMCTTADNRNIDVTDSYIFYVDEMIPLRDRRR